MARVAGAAAVLLLALTSCPATPAPDVTHVPSSAPITSVPPVDNGTYTVSAHSRYDGAPNPVTVTVNGDLPYRHGEPYENHIENIDGKNVSWAAIIEKGWAAANGNSNKGTEGTEGTDLSNAEDHDVHNALYAITGKVAVNRNPGGPMTGVSLEQMQQDFAKRPRSAWDLQLPRQAGINHAPGGGVSLDLDIKRGPRAYTRGTF